MTKIIYIFNNKITIVIPIFVIHYIYIKIYNKSLLVLFRFNLKIKEYFRERKYLEKRKVDDVAFRKTSRVTLTGHQLSKVVDLFVNHVYCTMM